MIAVFFLANYTIGCIINLSETKKRGIKVVDEFILQRQLIQLGNQLSNRRDRDLAVQQLTSSQSAVLLYFAQYPGRRVQDLKDFLCVTHQAAQKSVMKLRERQLLQSKVSPQDGRAHQLFLTSAGEKMAEKLRAHGLLAGQELLAPLTEKQKAQLAELVALLLKNNLDGR